MSIYAGEWVCKKGPPGAWRAFKKRWGKPVGSEAAGLVAREQRSGRILA